MKHFDKIRDKLRNQTEELPGEFSWENMEAGIVDNVKTPSRKWKRYLGLLLLVLVGSGVVFCFINDGSDLAEARTNLVSTESSELSNESKRTSDIETSQGKELNKVRQQEGNKDLESANKEGLQIDDSPVLNKPKKYKGEAKNESIINEIIPSSLTNQFPSQSNSTISKNMNANKLEESGELIKQETVTNPKEISLEYENQGESISDVTTVSIDQVEEVETRGKVIRREGPIDISKQNEILADKGSERMSEDEILLGRIKPLDILPIYLPWTMQEVSLDKALEPFNPELVNRDAMKNQIGISSGTIFNETLILGVNVETYFRRSLNKSVIFETGVNYSDFQWKIDEDFTRTYREEANNVLIAYEINPISMSRKDIFGDTTINVLETRKIIHHNSLQSIGIPFRLYLAKDLAKFRLLAGLGAELRIPIASRGKIVQDSEVLEFSKSSEYLNGWAVGISTNFELQYLINQKWSIALRASYYQNVTQQSSLSQYKFRSRLFNTSLGVAYNF